MTRYHYVTDFTTGVRYSVKMEQTGSYTADGKEEIAYTVREYCPRQGTKVLKTGRDYHAPVCWKDSERVNREGAKFVLMGTVNNFEMEIE